MAFYKSQELAEGYQRWWDTRERHGVGLRKADVLTELENLKGSTMMEPDTVQVGTSYGGSISIGSGREQMLDETHPRSPSQTCFDKFEWRRNKVVAIYVCIADSLR